MRWKHVAHAPHLESVGRECPKSAVSEPQVRLGCVEGARAYLALWVVTSPEALATRQYRSQWGFAEWQPLITDWSRDLFDGGGRPEQAFAVQPEGSLRVVSFDGASEDEARSASAGQTDLIWLPVIGLDRHTPMIGLAPQSGSAAAPQNALPRAQAAVYRPISPLYTAAKSS